MGQHSHDPSRWGLQAQASQFTPRLCNQLRPVREETAKGGGNRTELRPPFVAVSRWTMPVMPEAESYPFQQAIFLTGCLVSSLWLQSSSPPGKCRPLAWLYRVRLGRLDECLRLAEDGLEVEEEGTASLTAATHPAAAEPEPQSATVLGPWNVGKLDPRLVKALTVIGFALPVVVYVVFLLHYQVNAIWQDQWDDVPVIRQSFLHFPDWSSLWVQHVDNRSSSPI